jgi:hypothetical protein
LTMMTKSRVLMAGLIAFLLGVPLTEKAFAGWEDILWSSLGLAQGITDVASDGS